MKEIKFRAWLPEYKKKWYLFTHGIYGKNILCVVNMIVNFMLEKI